MDSVKRMCRLTQRDDLFRSILKVYGDRLRDHSNYIKSLSEMSYNEQNELLIKYRHEFLEDLEYIAKEFKDNIK